MNSNFPHFQHLRLNPFKEEKNNVNYFLSFNMSNNGVDLRILYVGNLGQLVMDFVYPVIFIITFL